MNDTCVAWVIWRPRTPERKPEESFPGCDGTKRVMLCGRRANAVASPRPLGTAVRSNDTRVSLIEVPLKSRSPRNGGEIDLKIVPDIDCDRLLHCRALSPNHPHTRGRSGSAMLGVRPVTK